MIRVLIADTYPVVRQGLRQMLGEAADIYIVGEAATHTEVLHKVRAVACQLLVIDDRLLDSVRSQNGGLALLADLWYMHPSLQVLIFSMDTNSEVGLRSLKAGVSGYITMDSSTDELVKAIRMVADGRTYINEEMAEVLAQVLNENTDEPRHRSLSDREFQVVSLLGAGQTLTEAATTLGVGKTTIATYRTRILDKLNLRSSAEIVRYAVAHGLAG
ncbi:MAG: response regulator transcription factor [Chloroflexota bacterium]